MDLVWDGSHPRVPPVRGRELGRVLLGRGRRRFRAPSLGRLPRLPPAAFAAAAAAASRPPLPAPRPSTSDVSAALAAASPTTTPSTTRTSRSPTPSCPEGAGYSGEKDPVWDIVTTLARKDAAAEPLLSSYMYMSILSHDTLEQAVSFVLANRLADSTLLPTQLLGDLQLGALRGRRRRGLHPIRAAPRHSGDSRARPCVFVLRARAPLPQGFPRPPGAPRAARRCGTEGSASSR